MTPDGPTLVVVVTGMSGAGKSTAVHALEDLGFFCVDNLPTPVVAHTLEACAAGGVKRIALGIDVRVRGFLEDAIGMLDAVTVSGERDLGVLFLDASDEALLRRYSGTRRPHPLSTFNAQGAAASVLDGINQERSRLSPLRARATVVIDTTKLSVHDLRRQIVSRFGPGAEHQPRMMVRMMSFGFKYGPPVDADLLLDCRFLQNPYFVDHLRDHAGTEAQVRDYVLDNSETRDFVERAEALLDFCLPRFEREGRSYLTIAIGCTGGRHRSVAIAEFLARRIADRAGVSIEVVHRDIERALHERSRTEPDFIGGGPKGGGGAQ
jgi:RNase adapter protein RapZ